MYGSYSKSTSQKLTLGIMHLLIIAISYWLLFLHGIDLIGKVFSFPMETGEVHRRWIIIICGILYFIRVNINEFIFLKRAMMWSEALTIALWLFIVYCTFSFTGGLNSNGIGRTDYAGLTIYLIGSVLNSVSEFTRFKWKKKHENHGHLYTGGLFRLSRHINYFGDTVLFFGFAMLTRSVWSFIIPASLVVLFIFVNIPIMENYLRTTYGGEFDEYAHRTDKFIPFIY